MKEQRREKVSTKSELILEVYSMGIRNGATADSFNDVMGSIRVGDAYANGRECLQAVI